MEIEIKWLTARPLRDGHRENLIYTLNLEQIPEESGLYLFAREHGDSASVLYVGQALNLRSRIKQQLNATKLMKGMQNAPTGRRVVIPGVVITKPGQQIKRVLAISESAMIRRLHDNKHALLNKSGTARKLHFIMSSRSDYTEIVPRTLAYEE